jgi:dinuclear metal center YbgI/SA1388 family protein
MTLQTTVQPLEQVQAYLDELLQVEGLEPDSNGLVIEGPLEVTRVGLAVNCSFQAIDQAAQRGCHLLVSHHAAWPTTDVHLSGQKHDRLRELGIGLYVAHDCLDLARGLGTADALARAVRIAVQGPFKPNGEGEFGVHGMTVGNLSEFVTRVANQLGARVRTWRNNPSFGHVAVVPGYGARPEWLARAQALGCDTFLSGEGLMFGLLFAREAGINLVLAGHYATETPGMMALGARLARDLKLDITFIPEAIVEEEA